MNDSPKNVITPRATRDTSHFLSRLDPPNGHLAPPPRRFCACAPPLAPALRRARVPIRGFATPTPSAELKKTGLYDFHVAHGAKMVPFAGYSMPLVYGSFHGPTTTPSSNGSPPSSLASLAPYSSTLSVLLNEKGGIIDDLMITKHAEDAVRTTSSQMPGAGRRDLAWFAARLDEWNAGEQGKAGKVEMTVLKEWGLLRTASSPSASPAFVPVEGFNLHVARGGYTGEDGYQSPPHKPWKVAALLLGGEVQLTGLGARDSLRLEAGLCLYGTDLDEETGPVEAGLAWVVGKDRRETGTFIGADGVRQQLKEGPPRRRVGLVVDGAVAREGAKIVDRRRTTSSRRVTSGIPSPTLGTTSPWGYVRNGSHRKGTQLGVEVRGKVRGAKVVGMPFVGTRYWRGV
ncbi:glycine cleavage system T protein [Mycena olivaceomarginata]|nr:glycine cleavage system T protein [Mycena olivaceomarginata]